MPPSNNPNELVSDLFQQLGANCTTNSNNASYNTKAHWCLREGMNHILNAHGGALTSIIKKEGIPTIYLKNDTNCRHDNNDSNDDNDLIQAYKEPYNCFQSLCRIITGQQLAGSAATIIWNRLVATTENNVSPNKILELSDKGIETYLQKPAGLSRVKSHSIVELSKAFMEGTLSELFLSSGSEEEIRKALMNIKGIGPWSCDMFLIFYLERPDVFPMGDLAVRKGVAKLFSLKGSGPKGSLCPKKDNKKMEQIMQPYQPYRSIATYYMWKIIDIKQETQEKKRKADPSFVETVESPQTPLTPTKVKRTRRTLRKVTP